MRLMKSLVRILKYYLVIHLTTLFIYLYDQAVASTFYILSLFSMAIALIFGISMGRYILLNILLAMTLSMINLFGLWMVAVVLLVLAILWKDLILLLR